QRGIAGCQRGCQALFDLHGRLLAGEFVVSGFGQLHQGGVGWLLLELDGKRRRGVPPRAEQRRDRAGGEKVPTPHDRAGSSQCRDVAQALLPAASALLPTLAFDNVSDSRTRVETS